MSTIDTIISTIRNSAIIDPSKVNYGVSDDIHPPYIQVFDYQHVLTYDTAGIAMKDATFSMHFVAKGQGEAEELATTVDGLLNTKSDVTAHCIGCFQESYQVGQLDKLYQFGVLVGYSLKEDYRK